MAERVGFEPTSRFLVNTLSKRAPSATRTPLRASNFNEYSTPFWNRPQKGSKRVRDVKVGV